jgi:succinate dehydrogenase / fumarate reductase cytochrome b subunit
MRWGGVILLLFIVYHIMHLTLGVVGFGAGQYQHPEGEVFNTYANTINAFRFWPSTVFYIIAMGALGLHLYHGVWSMFQTLGLNNYKTNAILRVISAALALALAIGFVSVPVAVLTGIVQ